MVLGKDIKISSAYFNAARDGERIPCLEILEHGDTHTDNVIRILVGRNEMEDKYAETFFHLDTFDDEETELKGFSLHISGGEEREMFIDMLEAAVEILKTGELEVTANANI